jgi:hypothetical protein
MENGTIIQNNNNNTIMFHDGGRSEYFRGKNVGDCVTRSIAIASGMDYKIVYDTLAKGNAKVTGSKSARNGIFTKRKWFQDQMREWGFEWVSVMSIGSGVTMHLRRDELPHGRIICRCSKHYTAAIDGVIHDTYDPTRDGTRAVYGYWKFNK